MFDISVQAFLSICFIGIWISAPGVLLDIDHIWAKFIEHEYGRWLHELANTHPLVFLLYSLLWGAIITTFTYGWILTIGGI